MDDQAILCFVNGPWAFFTTATLDEQWGDDWDDAPYEHNAGEPNTWTAPDPACDHQVIRVAFHAELRAPCDDHINSPWSVQAINRGATPWLRSPAWARENVEIYAGCTLRDFREIVRRIGGEVYEVMAVPPSGRGE
jgi:hypothetical protein